MAKIVWDQIGSRYYETGTDHGVLYLRDGTGAYPEGVAWNGLTAVTLSPSGAEASPLYADNIKYLELISTEELGFSVECFTYPDQWAKCVGEAELAVGVSLGQQAHEVFGMCYRTIVGNDVKGNDLGYKLHLIYGARAGVSEKAYTTVNDSPEAITFSYECTTTPVEVAGFKPTSHIEIDSTKVDSAKLKLLEDALYGTEDKEAYLPLPAELVTMLGTAA